MMKLKKRIQKKREKMKLRKRRRKKVKMKSSMICDANILMELLNYNIISPHQYCSLS